MSIRQRRRLLATLAATFTLVATAIANEATNSAAGGALSLAAVERLVETIRADETLEDADCTAAVDACRRAAEQLERRSRLEERAAELTAAATSAGADAADAQAALDALPETAKRVVRSADLQTLEQELAKVELQAAEFAKKVASLTEESQGRVQRRKAIHARLAEIASLLTESQGHQELSVATVHPLVSRAKSYEATAMEWSLEQEDTTLRHELTQHEAEDAAELLRLRIDLTTRRAAIANEAIQALRQRVEEIRESDADELVRKARREAIDAHPELKSHADENHTLAESAQQIARDLGRAEKDLSSSSAAYSRLQKHLGSTRRRVETVGLTSSVGALLRKQRQTLPDTRERVAAVAARRELIDEMQYRLFEYDDARQELGDVDARVAEVVAGIETTSKADEDLLTVAARDLIERKREYLKSLRDSCNRYFETLVELDSKDRQVVDLVRRYAEYIDERVLWIRSGKPLHQDFWPEESDRDLANHERWAVASSAVVRDARQAPWPYLLVASVIGLSLFRGRSLRRRIDERGEQAEKANCRSMAPTLDALVVTAIVAGLGPMVVAVLAWRLVGLGDEVAVAIGYGLASASVLWLVVNLTRHVCRSKGLGPAHFGWSSYNAQTLRRHAGWLAAVGMPSALVTRTLVAWDSSYGNDAVERAVFIIGMSWVAVVLAHVASTRGLLREHVAYHKNGWVDRLRFVWPVVAAASPLTLAVLAFVGYYYTASVLAEHLLTTACLLGLAVVTRSAMLRWLQLRRRVLSIEQAKARAAAAAEADGDPGVAGIVAAEPKADLKAHSEQTRRLVTSGVLAAAAVGIWFVWVGVLPALSMLDNYPLWTNTPVANIGDTTGTPLATNIPAEPTDGGELASPPTRTSVTTLSDLAVAVLIAVLTFVVVRNGPGLLELAVLQQLPLDASVRYAVTTLVSYAIVLIGVIASCSTIGLQWSQVQWLVTALTFGLAFGLQEMFANFVAGLIILLERPIRVGDVVTVDGIDGVVSKIRIRATSITNWDRKEYVVPNKEFITGRLLNWTLSDQINRIVINVGVAYGADTDRARELLLAAANEHPLILKEPASLATFEGFGDNSLNLVLRTYLPNLDKRLDVIHELHSAINRAFQAEGIEIAFPQRDLHIRSAPSVIQSALTGVSQEAQPERDAA